MARLVLAAFVVLIVACSGDAPSASVSRTATHEAGATSTPTATSTATGTTKAPSGVPRRIELEEAFGGVSFDRPVELGVYPGGRFFLADQGGLVTLLTPDGEATGTLLDLAAVVHTSYEEGLLSLALDPEFASRPYLYAYYSASDPRRTVLSRFEVFNDTAERASELVILEVAQPFPNHKGGAIRFGPDGMLYLGLGDGGGQGDPSNNGQNLGVLLGKMLRIDVRTATAEQPYVVPSDNPFVGQAGARPEIWALGLRNPWRATFDPATGRLWAGDVGASAVEEVNIVERDGNYGWDRLEGDDCHEPRSDCDRAGTIGPVASYTHDDGCSITGGVVYRGSALPALAGNYLYGDYCSGRIWALPVDGSSEPVTVAEADGTRRVSSFATDADGEVYLLIHGGPILRIAGAD